MQNKISVFHLKTKGKEGTIKESVHEEHLAWKGKHNRCMFVCNGVFSRIRVLVSIVGLVNSVNILLSELFCDTYSRFHSFTSLLNMNLSFLGGDKKGLPVQYSYRTASNQMKKRASNGSVKYCKCHERTKSCIGGANKGCGYIMGVGVGCHTI